MESESNLDAEKMLDKIYHALPEWVNRAYRDQPLNERVAQGFKQQEESWQHTYMKEVQNHTKMREFVIWLCKTHGHDFENNYWNFLVSKDLENASEEEKKRLTKMIKPV